MVDELLLRSQAQWGIRTLPWMILTDENHNVTAEGFSLPLMLGRRLPALADFNPAIDLDRAEGKQILLCIGNLHSSWITWYSMKALGEISEQLFQKGIVVYTIQTLNFEPEELQSWYKEYNDNKPFNLPIHVPEKSIYELMSTWTGYSRPPIKDHDALLILTNREHVVVAENFCFLELDEKIQQSQTKEPADDPLIYLQTK